MQPPTTSRIASPGRPASACNTAQSALQLAPSRSTPAKPYQFMAQVDTALQLSNETVPLPVPLSLWLRPRLHHPPQLQDFGASTPNLQSHQKSNTNRKQNPTLFNSNGGLCGRSPKRSEPLSRLRRQRHPCRVPSAPRTGLRFPRLRRSRLLDSQIRKLPTTSCHTNRDSLPGRFESTRTTRAPEAMV